VFPVDSRVDVGAPSGPLRSAHAKGRELVICTTHAEAGRHEALAGGSQARQRNARAIDGRRALSAVEALARVRPLFGPVGITRVANVTGLDCVGIPVVAVCRPNSRSLSVSQGKGLTLEAARASGVMEAIELYHAERIALPLKLGSWNDFRFSHGLAAVERLPRTCASDFCAEKPILWIEGSDLLGSRPLWVPYEVVHQNYTLPFPTGTGCFVMSSNGLASGCTKAEALSHGLCEVIERDAKTLWRSRTVEEQEQVRVDLDTVRDDGCRRLLDCYERADVVVGCWEITSDIGVAAFLCVVQDREPSPLRRLGPIEGMGCHPIPEIALGRALTEAAQGRLTLIAGSRDDNTRDRYSESREQSLAQRAHERLKAPGRRGFQQAPSFDGETSEADVAFLLHKLQSAGFSQAIAVDLTKPELGVPVVRIVVPGLEPYHNIPGYVPGARARAILAAGSSMQ